MAWDEMESAKNEAMTVMRRAERVASDIASLLIGNLRNVDRCTLVKLKRELHRFNANTRKWKEGA